MFSASVQSERKASENLSLTGD